MQLMSNKGTYALTIAVYAVLALTASAKQDEENKSPWHDYDWAQNLFQPSKSVVKESSPWSSLSAQSNGASTLSQQVQEPQVSTPVPTTLAPVPAPTPSPTPSLNSISTTFGAFTEKTSVYTPLTKSSSSSLTSSLYTTRDDFAETLSDVDVDAFSPPAYPSQLVIMTNSDMNDRSKLVSGTEFTTTGFSDYNVVNNGQFCGGCNGSFEMNFANAMLSMNGDGVYGAGFDYRGSTSSAPYTATVTYGDDATQDFTLPESPDQDLPSAFFGLTDFRLIKSIHIGAPDGKKLTGGIIAIDNLTVGREGAVSAFVVPSQSPSGSPSVSAEPTTVNRPSRAPSDMPIVVIAPSAFPSTTDGIPSRRPSSQPSVSAMPSAQVSAEPSGLSKSSKSKSSKSKGKGSRGMSSKGKGGGKGGSKNNIPFPLSVPTILSTFYRNTSGKSNKSGKGDKGSDRTAPRDVESLRAIYGP